MRNVRLIAFVFLVGAQAASAQNYDANCNRQNAGTDQGDAEIAKAWGPLQLGLAIAEKACQGKEFLTRLLTKEPDLDRVSPAEVFDAARPELPSGDSLAEHYRQEQAAAQHLKMREEEARLTYLRANPANEAVTESNAREADARAAGQTVQYSTIRDPAAPPPGPETYTYTTLPPLKPDGFVTIFESADPPQAGSQSPTAPTRVDQIDGEGTLISADGMKSGHFENGELDGEGQEITADGVWRGGHYQNGDIEGQGFEVFEDGDKVVGVEANFVDDHPDGLARVTLSDGSSRTELWTAGERIAVGPLAAPGKEPVAAVYKSPAQLEAEDDRRFESSLKTAPNAAALYALADALAEKGETTRAREAFRQVLTRFPSSPFALRASDRLADSGGATGRSPAHADRVATGTSRPNPSLASTATIADGEWHGDSSGNSVKMQLRGNVITVFQVSSNAGQGNNGLQYALTGGGTYQASLDGGASSVIEVLASDTVRVTNSDGWTDIFRLVARAN